MSRRNPRGTCPGALTRTEQLRQAKTAALVRDLALKEAAAAKQRVEQSKPRRKIARPEPKKVDFTKPGMTKAMMARVQKAEAFKQEYERKQQLLKTGRVPKRTAAPIGGDARMGVEKPVARTARTAPVTPTAKKGVIAKRAKSPQKTLTKKTAQLAKVMKADVIQAEPIGEGPINNIVIPPGVVNEERTTIVNIVPPSVAPETGVSQISNRSIQAISETLDEQDALETAEVHTKLADLQQARRDFVITVANVGGNAVRSVRFVDDESAPPPIKGSLEAAAKYLIKIPDPEYYAFDYESKKPIFEAARKHIEVMEALSAYTRMAQEFREIAAGKELSGDMLPDEPFDPELLLDEDVSWEEDEMGLAMPVPSRVKAYADLPVQPTPYEYQDFEPEELGKFFDTRRHPPPARHGPPEGREHLHPDLWELEDPWFKAPPCYDPDLIDF